MSPVCRRGSPSFVEPARASSCPIAADSQGSGFDWSPAAPCASTSVCESEAFEASEEDAARSDEDCTRLDDEGEARADSDDDARLADEGDAGSLDEDSACA